MVYIPFLCLQRIIYINVQIIVINKFLPRFDSIRGPRKNLVQSTYTTTKSTQRGNKSCINHHKQVGKLAYFRKQLDCAKGSAIVLIMKSKEIARRWLPLAPQVYNSVKHYNSIRNMYVNVRRRMLYSLEWLNFKSRGQEDFVRIKNWFWMLVLHQTQIPII